MNGRRIVLWAFALGFLVVSLGAGCSRKKNPVTMRLESATKIRMICVGYLTYMNAHDDKIPGSLAEIAPHVAGGVLPESPRKWEGFDGPSYIYVKALAGRDFFHLDSSDKYVLVYENPIICKDEIAVGFADGHGLWMPMEEFRTALAETYKLPGVPMPE